MGFSAPEGRLMVAQRFIAGKSTGCRTRPVGTSETLSGDGVQACLRHAHRPIRPPATEEAGYYQRSLRDLGSKPPLGFVKGKIGDHRLRSPLHIRAQLAQRTMLKI